MISKTPEQMLLYNARLKFHRNEVARMLHAQQEAMKEGRLEGVEIGEARGQQTGRITLMQELLGLRVFTAEEFAGWDMAQLNNLADQLHQQLRARNS